MKMTFRFMKIISLVLLFYLFLTSNVYSWQESDEPIYVSSLPKVSETDQFKIGYIYLPYGLAVDDEGSIYIAQVIDDQVLKYDSNYNLVGQWGGPGRMEGEFDSPYGVSIGNNGLVYVADGRNDRIQVFNKNGEFQFSWGQGGSGNGYFNIPYDMAFDSEGNVYITDNNNHRIQKFTSDGQFIQVWENAGAAGNFNYPRGIEVFDGEVYVVDGRNNRILKFDLNGNLNGSWGEYGTTDGKLNDPRDLEIDDSGNIYIVDSNNYRIQKFDSSGVFQTKVGGTLGYGDDEFQYPLSIIKGTSDNLIVGDVYSLSFYNSDLELNFKVGQYSDSDGFFARPTDVAFDSEDNIYVIDFSLHRVQKFNPDGNFLRKWGEFGTNYGQFDSPCAIAVDKFDAILVADCENHRIQKFDSRGRFLMSFGEYGTGDGQFNLHFDNTHAGIDFDSQGNIYITDSRNNRIQKFNSQGEFILSWGGPGSGDGEFGTFSPTDVLVNSSGEVLTVDRGNYRIQVFDQSGSFLRSWGHGSFGTRDDGALSYPQDLVEDHDGNIYTLDEQGNVRVQKFDQNEEFILDWGEVGSAPGQMKVPRGMEMNSKGEIFIADLRKAEVLKFVFDRNPPIISSVTFDENFVDKGKIAFSGNISDSYSNITSVEFSINDKENDWQNCEALDGAFDSKSEEFMCFIDEVDFNSKYNIYIRSTDSYTNTNTTLDTGSSFDIYQTSYDYEEEILTETGGQIKFVFVLTVVFMISNIPARRKRSCK